MFKKIPQLLIAFTLLFSLIVNSQVSFDSENIIFDEDLHSAGIVKSLIPADIDGDGDLDFIDANTKQIKWFENDGSGDYARFVTHIISANEVETTDVFATDLDNDGDLDLLAARRYEDTSLWYENDGNGEFSNSHIISVGDDGPVSILSFDIDNDGFNDIIVGLRNDEMTVWYKNNGDNTFAPKQIINDVSQYVSKIFLEDLDGDGIKDIVSTHESGRLLYNKNFGNGTFGSAITITYDISYANTINFDDIDNDNDIDIVGTSDSGESIIYFLNNADGTFTSPITVASFDDTPIQLSTADYDNDGDVDIIGIIRNPSKIVFYENIGDTNNNGETEFNQSLQLESPYIEADENPKFFQIIDSNNDGHIDIFYLSDSAIQGIYQLNGTGSTNFTVTKFGYVLVGASYMEGADLDNDGDNDILISTFEAISWLRNDGTGNFGNPVLIKNLPGSTAPEFRISDFDNDGDYDIISSVGYTFRLYINDGDANFSEGQILSTEGIVSLDCEDINNDGFDDIIAIEYLSSGSFPLNIYYNLGNGSFGVAQPVSNSASLTPFNVRLSDIDGNGSIDIITDDIVWYQNDGSGNFSNFISITGGGAEVHEFEDMDNNGLIDIIYGSRDNDLVGLIKNLGNGEFANAQALFGIEEIQDIIIGDIDNDNDKDICVTARVNENGQQGSNSFYLNTGNGNMGLRNVMNSVGSISYRRIGCLVDVNNDAKLDYIASYTPEGTFGLFLNNSILSLNSNNFIKPFLLPNPSSRILTIQNIEDIQKIDIYDMNGRLVKRNFNQKEINVESLENAIYIVKIKDRLSNESTLKFIKN